MKTFESAMMDLFLEVFKAYVERKDEKILIPGQRVVRGTSVSNSSVYENHLGLLLHTQITDDYRILVDYPIIFPGRNQRITPDILILKDNTLQMIIELKVDLGYEKDGWEKIREERLDKLRINKNSTGYKPLDEDTLEKGNKILIEVPDEVEYATVIFCHKNGSKKIAKVVDSCKSSSCEDRGDYPFFVLLRDEGLHPNDFTSLDLAASYLESMRAEHKTDWSVFESYLRNRLKFKDTEVVTNVML